MRERGYTQEGTDKISVVDLIINVLREHEKELDDKIGALDGVIADLKRQTEKIEEIIRGDK